MVEGNIVQFSDNNAIRLETNPKDIELVNNAFAQSLFCVVYRTEGTIFVDDSMFAQLKDLGFKRCEGNVLQVPNLPIDQPWFDKYLGRTAYVKGKVTMDEWNQVRELLGQPLVSTGAKLPEGMAPAYDRKSALQLFPRNPECKAGARRRELPVKFEGVPRVVENHEYTETTWEAVRDTNAWNGLDGKRIKLVFAVRGEDPQYTLPGIEKSTHSSWSLTGPKGIDSGGMPIRAYARAGTRVERGIRAAKVLTTGPAQETYWISGVVHTPRQFVIEAIERAD